MGFIKHALIGIALYESVKYFLKERETLEYAKLTEGVQAVPAAQQQLRGEDVDIIAGARQVDQLKRMKDNAAANRASADNSRSLTSETRLGSQDAEDDLEAGNNPETPLTGHEPDVDQDDPWKKSLANDELRAPDS